MFKLMTSRSIRRVTAGSATTPSAYLRRPSKSGPGLAAALGEAALDAILGGIQWADLAIFVDFAALVRQRQLKGSASLVLLKLVALA